MYIATRDDLEAAGKRGRLSLYPRRTKVTVGMATCGLASGAEAVYRALTEEVEKRGLDILVTRATDPGWTPVFPLVSGLVTEVGGQLSHMAIIAREYGVPAVVNVRDAMRQIQDGTTITVDGTAGEVHLIQDKEGGG